MARARGVPDANGERGPGHVTVGGLGCGCASGQARPRWRGAISSSEGDTVYEIRVRLGGEGQERGDPWTLRRSRGKLHWLTPMFSAGSVVDETPPSIAHARHCLQGNAEQHSGAKSNLPAWGISCGRDPSMRSRPAMRLARNAGCRSSCATLWWQLGGHCCGIRLSCVSENACESPAWLAFPAQV